MESALKNIAVHFSYQSDGTQNIALLKGNINSRQHAFMSILLTFMLNKKQYDIGVYVCIV